MPRQEQTTIDVKQFSARLVECSIIAGRKRIPIILFRKIIDEAKNAVQEEVAMVVQGYILDLVYSFGGFISTTFHRLRIFTPDEFAAWILRRERQLVLQCIDNLKSTISMREAVSIRGSIFSSVFFIFCQQPGLYLRDEVSCLLDNLNYLCMLLSVLLNI